MELNKADKAETVNVPMLTMALDNKLDSILREAETYRGISQTVRSQGTPEPRATEGKSPEPQDLIMALQLLITKAERTYAVLCDTNIRMREALYPV